MSKLLKLYRISQVPAAFALGYLTFNESQKVNDPEIISVIAEITCGILGSFAWPIITMNYGYNEIKEMKEFKEIKKTD